MSMNRVTFGMFDVAEFVDRLAYDIKHAAQGSLSDRHRNWPARINCFHPTNHAVSWQHRNGSNSSFAQVLLHFGDQVDGSGYIKSLGHNPESLVDRGQVPRLKLDVNYRTNNLHDAACRLTIRNRICAGRSHTFFSSYFR